MAIIKPKIKDKKIKLQVKIFDKTHQEIEQYCKYVGFESFDEFIEESARHIFEKDKEFQKWKKTCSETKNAGEKELY